MDREIRIKTHRVFNMRVISAVMLSWTALAIIATTTSFIALRLQTFGGWWSIFEHMLSYYYTWAVFAFCVYALISHSIYKTKLALPILAALFIGFTFISPFTAHFTDWREWLYGERAIGFHALNISIFIIVLLGSKALNRYQQSLELERQSAEDRLRANQLESKLTTSRLQTLRMQINPHFLFNALNSIGALVETRANNRAYRAIEVLAQLLRNMLDRVDTQHTSVADELEFIQSYVEMEKIRFADKLHFNCEIADDCSRQKIPVSVLQPLIENAIKHAVSPSTSPVTIGLQVNKCDQYLRIEVTDSGCSESVDDANAPVHAPGGVGLTNIRDHLTLLYGQNYSFDISQQVDDGGTRVSIKLPRKNS